MASCQASRRKGSLLVLLPTRRTDEFGALRGFSAAGISAGQRRQAAEASSRKEHKGPAVLLADWLSASAIALCACADRCQKDATATAATAATGGSSERVPVRAVRAAAAHRAGVGDAQHGVLGGHAKEAAGGTDGCDGPRAAATVAAEAIEAG